MYAPRPPMASCETNKPRQSLAKKRCTIGLCLLIWAYFRLAVSSVWSSIIFIATMQDMFRLNQHGVLGPIASSVQILEMSMLVTLIVAGHKRSAKLYRIYFYYCIVTLLVYTAASIWIYLPIDDVVYLFVQNYLTIHFTELFAEKYDGLVYGVTFVLDIFLEILLLVLIKKQIKKCCRDTDDDEDLRTEEERVKGINV